VRAMVTVGVLSLAVLGRALPGSAGTVTGTVTLVEKGGKKASDLSEVVVYVEGVKARGARASSRPNTATMTMKGKAFTPRVVAVPVGGTVEFPNDDPIFHNVFSVSGENRFDLSLYKRPRKGLQAFAHPGVVKVYCNIHPQMAGVVMVADSPYFAKAAPDGSFAIEDVPAGKYMVKAFHEKAPEVAVEVTVPAQGDAKAPALSLDASTYKRVQHKNKFGKDYSTEEKY
jgi:plastocyanin